MRTSLRVRLEDTGGSPLFSDADLNEMLAQALGEYGSVVPKLALTTVTVAADATEITLPGTVSDYAMVALRDATGGDVRPMAARGFDLDRTRLELCTQTAGPAGMTTDAAISVVPANEASCADLQAVLGTRGDPSRCQCQRYKMRPRESWASVGTAELASRLREQTNCGHPEAGTTCGLVAYLSGEPVGC